MLLSVAAALLLAACTPAEELPSEGVESTADADTKRPTIRIAASEVIIGKGDDFDLLDGVVGSDDVDGDITDRIEIDKGDYDPGIAGKYTITYNLTDSAGNAAMPKQRIINVRETDVMEKPPIWNDAIEGEKRNPQDPAVYGGAWHHKVVSSKDKWVGIEATVTLPEFKIERYEGEYDGVAARRSGGHASRQPLGVSRRQRTERVRRRPLAVPRPRRRGEANAERRRHRLPPLLALHHRRGTGRRRL